eukprot:TRINITY_DN5980_c0_g1_i1.p1 TRINITY_DN5980_c0_g1~~TRINITY_DN5980_c0_g1_i1.p1  ORF type:complete len:416 (+),score=128.29 TRINITY_DN5980_c0_g1_i1:47-1249(+)
MRSVILMAMLAAASADFTAPRFTMDLAQPPYDRYTPVVNYLLDTHGYEYVWGPLHDFLDHVLTQDEWKETAPLWDDIFLHYPTFYQEELVAFHKLVIEHGHPEWTMGQLVMVQLFYEVEDACTSIVAQNTNGSIFHGRNLDYGLPGLQNFTATIDFTRNGKPISTGTMYVGYCGLLTGQHVVSPGRASWSISLDQRFYGKSVIPYEDTIKELLQGVQNVGFTLRDALGTQDNFTAATKLLGAKPIPAPAYLILSGVEKDEGVVITRDRNGTSAAAGTGRGYWPIDTAAGAWYRLETNFDNWEPITDGRRKTANEGMQKIGESGANNDGLMQVLSTPNVLNSGTTYTAHMQNEVGYYSTTVRTHPQEVNERRTGEMKDHVKAKMQQLLQWYRTEYKPARGL